MATRAKIAIATMIPPIATAYLRSELRRVRRQGRMAPSRDPSSRGPDIPDIPVQPYVSQRRVRYEEPRRVDLPREFAREPTTDSMRARRTPIPTIESQSKPPTKFKGEDSTFIKVDVFLKKMERRRLRNGHGLDLATEDIACATKAL
jgi:hypothetical protein